MVTKRVVRKTYASSLGLLPILVAIPFQLPLNRAICVHVSSLSRMVTKYSDLEQQLNRAIQHRDEATLNKLLADDFEQWTPAPPGDPVPREDWLHDALATFALRSFKVRQMAVREVGDAAAVSFVLDQQASCDGHDCSGTRFIVDLWQPHNGAAQLLVRYDSETLAQRPPPLASKPSGKE